MRSSIDSFFLTLNMINKASIFLSKFAEANIPQQNPMSITDFTTGNIHRIHKSTGTWFLVTTQEQCTFLWCVWSTIVAYRWVERFYMLINNGYNFLWHRIIWCMFSMFVLRRLNHGIINQQEHLSRESIMLVTQSVLPKNGTNLHRTVIYIERVISGVLSTFHLTSHRNGWAHFLPKNPIPSFIT